MISEAMLQLDEASYETTGLDVYVSPPVERGDGDWYLMIAHDWHGYEEESASRRMRKFQNRQTKSELATVAVPTEEEAAALKAATGRYFKPASVPHSSYSLRLDALDAKEAAFHHKMIVSELEGLGFDVKTGSMRTKNSQGGPYR